MRKTNTPAAEAGGVIVGYVLSKDHVRLVRDKTRLGSSRTLMLQCQTELKGKGLKDPDARLRRVSGFAFQNTSRYDFDEILVNTLHLAANGRNYIASFRPDMREVLKKFNFGNTIIKLDETGLLFQVLRRFKKLDLRSHTIDNPTMDTIFEELTRKFNEALNESLSSHFTRAARCT